MPNLQNIFKRDDIRGIYPAELNGTVAEALGRALVALLHGRSAEKVIVAVGRDCRNGSLELSQGLMRGIRSAGGEALDLGQVSTEHVYYFCGEHAECCSAGCMVTASHNPKEYNGMKFLYSGCVPLGGEDLLAMRQGAEAALAAGCGSNMAKAGQGGEGQMPAAMLDFEEYASAMLRLAGLKECVPGQNEVPFRLVVLGGHGMGGFAFAPLARQLAAQGLEVVLVDGEPDGDFPDGVPNPLLPEFVTRLGALVKAHQADLGVVFDGDADRAGFVDAEGQEIIPSQILVLMAGRKAAQLPEGQHGVLVGNLCCSHLLQDFCRDNNRLEFLEAPVGHGRIKQLMRSDRYCRTVFLGGEHSGHFFFPEFHYVDSGVLTTLNVLALAWQMKREGRSLAVTLAPWRKKYAWSGEKNYTLPTVEATRKAIVSVWERFSREEGVLRYGVKWDDQIGAHRSMVCEGAYAPAELSAPDLKFVHDQGEHGWWFVVRPSGNEPKLRLNVEAWGEGAAEKMRSLVAVVEPLLAK